jgi:hypothetical protein
MCEVSSVENSLSIAFVVVSSGLFWKSQLFGHATFYPQLSKFGISDTPQVKLPIYTSNILAVRIAWYLSSPLSYLEG